MSPDWWRLWAVFLAGIVFGYAGLGSLAISVAAFIVGFCVAALAASDAKN